jgi:hypothetical protein
MEIWYINPPLLRQSISSAPERWTQLADDDQDEMTQKWS